MIISPVPSLPSQKEDREDEAGEGTGPHGHLPLCLHGPARAGKAEDHADPPQEEERREEKEEFQGRGGEREGEGGRRESENAKSKGPKL